MKKRTLLLALLACCISSVMCQNRLAESERRSNHVLVYKIGAKELYRFNNEKDINYTTLLGDSVTQYLYTDTCPNLPFGNYILVSSNEGKLILEEHTHDDFIVTLIPGELLQFRVTNTKGENLPNIEVRHGKRKAKYNSKLQLYYFNNYKPKHFDPYNPNYKNGNKGIITFNNNGVYHYEKIVKYYVQTTNKKYVKVKQQKVSSKKKKGKENEKIRMKGFMVTNKPKYKPNETVKFKLYATDNNDVLYNEPIDIVLQYQTQSSKQSFRSLKDTVLVRELKPYRPGMYHSEFILSDSLNLLLDTKCTIKIESSNNKLNWNNLKNNFSYEEYELKGINLNLTRKKEKYYSGEPSEFTIIVDDENSMPVYGGKAEIVITPTAIINKENNKDIFIPDTLWFEQLDMSEQADNVVVIPDSIFPKNVNFYYLIQCTYWSPDNEKHVAYLSQQRANKRRDLSISIDKGIATMKAYDGGSLDTTQAEVLYYGYNNRLLEKREVMLPYADTIPWYIGRVEVKDSYGNKASEQSSLNGSPLQSSLTRKGDSILVQVNSITSIPFWYRLMDNKKLVASGYSTELNRCFVAKKRVPYQLTIDYIYGGILKQQTENLDIINQYAYLEIETPLKVYPGEEAELQFSMTNEKGEPIANADITAYGYTSKFNTNNKPFIDTYKQVKKASQVVTVPLKKSDRGVDHIRDSKIDSLWQSQLGLDSIEYYKFLFPNRFYHYAIPSADSSTQLIPYVVKEGDIMNNYLLWIDNILYHYANSEQQRVYSFEVTPGKHNLRFRINDRIVLLHNVPVIKGHRNYYSVDGTLPEFIITDNTDYLGMKMYSDTVPQKSIGRLTAGERELLAKELMVITPKLNYLSMPGIFTSGSQIDAPLVLETFGNYYYLNPAYTSRREGSKQFKSKSVLVGPFPKRSYTEELGATAKLYSNNKAITFIPLEGNSEYTIYEDALKSTSNNFDSWLNNMIKYDSELILEDKPLSRADIDSTFKADLQKVISQTTSMHPLYNLNYKIYKQKGKLQLQLLNNKDQEPIKPMLILFSPIEHSDSLTKENYQLYYGGTREFDILPYGKINLTLIINDSLSYTRPIEIKPGGNNYLSLDSISYEKHSALANFGYQLFMNSLEINQRISPYHLSNGYNLNKAERRNQSSFYSGTVVDSEGEPIIGAAILKKGSNIGTIADFDGNFSLDLFPNDVIEVSYMGYQTATIRVKLGEELRITLIEEKTAIIYEAVVEGYSTKTKRSYVNSAAAKVPEVEEENIAFTNEDVDVISLEEDVMIENVPVPDSPKEEEEVSINGGGNMRRNFHDDAFWQPAIRTNAEGKATVTVTYPDDITEWDTYYIGIGNNNKQMATKELKIKSYLSLSARLSLPHFAVRGDSIEAIGRVVNYLPQPIELTETVAFNGDTVSESIQLNRSYINKLPINAGEGDSLELSYSIHHNKGFFDGEERKIPITEQGLMKSFGEFKILTNSKPYTFIMNPILGDVTLYAESSAIDLFKRELGFVIHYIYDCNEQMASKINALLLLKKLNQLQGEKFKHEKELKRLIDNLCKNQNSEQLWGWWNQGSTEYWISEYVLNTLLDAKDAGYNITINENTLKNYLQGMVEKEIRLIRNSDERKHMSKNHIFIGLELLKRLGADYPYRHTYEELDAMLPSRGLTERLEAQQTLYKLELFDLMSKDSVVKDMQRSILGNYYWKEKEKDVSLWRSPNVSNIENSLMGYELLKLFQVSEDTISGVQNYFFENRNGNHWGNTYESMRIITTLIPDLLQEVNRMEKTTFTVNGKEITTLPYKANLGEVDKVTVSKSGTLPLFVTTYQEQWVENPEVVNDKGFTIETYFKSNNKAIDTLKAGRTVTLEVQVSLSGEANYVMLEIPIPAGCSYEKKERGRNSYEVHREYYKDKVVIFCNRLTEGEHTFKIELLPRYNGVYTINPANIELMYYPTIQGNNEIRKVNIAEY